MESKTKSGDNGEIIAIRYLLKNGYRICATNYKIKGGEIDVISELGGNTIFIEVKYRKNDSHGSPEEALTKTKKKNILRTIRYYMMKNGIREENVRFHFIGITEIDGTIKINHLKDVEL
ncbi:MAG: YraN family protein [Candidatus Gracilibacteria bacterium]|nr:YraN family protein [Candidatus Gracilibacteria bacterium]